MSNPQERAPAGAVIVRANVAGTALFAVTAIMSAVVFDGIVTRIGAMVALLLFFVGIVAFLWSFWSAVQRSRGEQVAVTQLYLLFGGVAPPSIRRTMLLALGTQVVVGMGTALGRPNQLDGSPGTSLALGVLVPIFGFGLNGLWAAFHGEYRERPPESTSSRRSQAGVRTTEGPIGQNEDHG